MKTFNIDSCLKLPMAALLSSLFLTACGMPSSNPNIKPTGGEVISSSDLLCKTEGYELIALENNNKQVLSESRYLKSILSGAASEFKDKIQAASISKSYAGLMQMCDAHKKISLELSCDGKIILIDDQKTETLSQQQLVSLSPIYVKKATVCGKVELQESEALFIVADQLILKDVSVVLNDSAVLSLSSSVIDGGVANLKSVTKVPRSSISIHTGLVR